MKLINIISQINDELVYKYCQSCLPVKTLIVNHNHKDFEISVELSSMDNVEVTVTNRNHYHREYPRIEEYVSLFIVSWYDIINAKTDAARHYICDGFRDELDYLNYKYG